MQNVQLESSNILFTCYYRTLQIDDLLTQYVPNSASRPLRGLALDVILMLNKEPLYTAFFNSSYNLGYHKN